MLGVTQATCLQFMLKQTSKDKANVKCVKIK